MAKDNEKVVIKKGISKFRIFVWCTNLVLLGVSMPPAYDHYHNMAVEAAYEWSQPQLKSGTMVQATQVNSPPTPTSPVMPPTLQVRQVAVDEGIVGQTFSTATGGY